MWTSVKHWVQNRDFLTISVTFCRRFKHPELRLEILQLNPGLIAFPRLRNEEFDPVKAERSALPGNHAVWKFPKCCGARMSSLLPLNPTMDIPSCKPLCSSHNSPMPVKSIVDLPNEVILHILAGASLIDILSFSRLRSNSQVLIEDES